MLCNKAGPGANMLCSCVQLRAKYTSSHTGLSNDQQTTYSILTLMHGIYIITGCNYTCSLENHKSKGLVTLSKDTSMI